MAKNIGLRPGKFGRERNFKPVEHGILKWWLMGVGESAGAVGREFIEIEEIVPTETRGNLVIYRQWIVDPDGCEVTGYWVSNRRKETKYRTERQLLRDMIKMGFIRDFPDYLAKPRGETQEYVH
jgi:hypothetical protein